MKTIIKNSQQEIIKMINKQHVLPTLRMNYYSGNKNHIKRRFATLKANEKDEYHYENYQVFQHQNITYNDDVNIKDIDDHLETVHKLRKTDKDDYFMSHGLDYERCHEYINVVKYLNRCWKMKHKHMNNDTTFDNNKKFSLKPLLVHVMTLFGIIAFIYNFVKEDDL